MVRRCNVKEKNELVCLSNGVYIMYLFIIFLKFFLYRTRTKLLEAQGRIRASGITRPKIFPQGDRTFTLNMFFLYPAHDSHSVCCV